MVLKSQSNSDIIIQVKQLVQNEKTLTVQIIETLLEIETRKAYLPTHTNMYYFLTEELGYCAGTAMLRLNAMRALKVVPEVREKILDNSLSLTDVAKTQGYINKVNRSADEPLTQAEQKELFQAAESASKKELETTLVQKHNEIEQRRAETSGGPKPEPRKILKKIIIEADPELLGLIEELKSLLSHKVVDGDLNKILKETLPLALRELKIKKGIERRTHKQTEITSSMRPQCIHAMGKQKILTRTIPVEIKRAVWRRDQGRCQHLDPVTNKICGSKFQVEFEHIRPWALNGEHSVSNIILHCKPHNLERWRTVERMNGLGKAEESSHATV